MTTSETNSMPPLVARDMLLPFILVAMLFPLWGFANDVTNPLVKAFKDIFLIDRSSDWRSQLPRRKFISANTKEYEFASYMAAWVAKVERVGNLNYPLELKARGVAGDLLMTVGVARDGSVESITIKRASGTPELDPSTSSSAEEGSPRKSMDILSSSSSINRGLRVPTLARFCTRRPGMEPI